MPCGIERVKRNSDNLNERLSKLEDHYKVLQSEVGALAESFERRIKELEKRKQENGD